MNADHERSGLGRSLGLDLIQYRNENDSAGKGDTAQPRGIPVDDTAKPAALDWQIDVWDRMAEIYLREIDRRFTPVIDRVLARADLKPGQRVLDLGTGTGAVAERASGEVGPAGQVMGVDISSEMLARAEQRISARGLTNVLFREGRAEEIPAENESFDVDVASLSLMFAIDRAASAREIARVLRPGGRVVAVVRAGPETCDLVRFQQIAGGFAPTPPVPGVGPGALADPSPFAAQLAEAGIQTRIDSEILGFDFDDFESAWNVFFGVTAAQLDAVSKSNAKRAVLDAMYSNGPGPRHFRNETRFIVGERGSAS
jgi:SAM-dependent methyltransferase